MIYHLYDWTGAEWKHVHTYTDLTRLFDAFPWLAVGFRYSEGLFEVEWTTRTNLPKRKIVQGYL